MCWLGNDNLYPSVVVAAEEVYCKVNCEKEYINGKDLKRRQSDAVDARSGSDAIRWRTVFMKPVMRMSAEAIWLASRCHQERTANATTP